MYYPVEVFLLGAASGATVALFFLLGLWFHHKDAALTLDMQSQMDFFFSKAMVWAFMMSFFCAIIAFSGLTLAGGTLPRLAWSIGAVVGTAAILILRWLLTQRSPRLERPHLPHGPKSSGSVP